MIKLKKIIKKKYKKQFGLTHQIRDPSYGI
jgi:hypothetical protein